MTKRILFRVLILFLDFSSEYEYEYFPISSGFNSEVNPGISSEVEVDVGIDSGIGFEGSLRGLKITSMGQKSFIRGLM